MMYLQDICAIGVTAPDADFWLVRRGSRATVGKPVRDYNREAIGVRVTHREVLNESYLFYWFMHLHSVGEWEKRATGSTELVNITVEMVRKIRIG